MRWYCIYLLVAGMIDKMFDLNDFIHPAVLRLVQSDSQKGTDFVETLDIYLKYKSAANEAAEKLYFHRSTLFYRIKKIRELTGIGFDNISEMSEVWMSLKILEIYGTDDHLSCLGADEE